MRHNIENDLLRILKSKKKTELAYTISNMINKTYKYEINYLNKVPYHVLMVYLEKIIVIGSKTQSVNNVDDCLKVMLRFSRNISNLRYRHLQENKGLNLKYRLKLQMAKLKGAFEKNKAVKITSLILATTILFSLCGKRMKLEANNNDTNDYNYESTLEETIAMESIEQIIIDYEEDVLTDEYLLEETEEEVIEDENLIQDESFLTEQNQSDIVNDDKVTTIYGNNVQYSAPNVAEVQEISLEEKVSNILIEYNLTQEQFNVIVAIVLSEAEANSYDDAYAVINTMYNRTINTRWITYIDSIWGDGCGRNLYYQAITPGQFVVYEEGIYKGNLGVTDVPGYEAVIDFLTTREMLHDYLAFRANWCDVPGSELFSERGNKYFEHMPEEERLIEIEDISEKSR